MAGVERFDVIVVGAGPAGSTAAYRLARKGASVLLADRAHFPRDKPCGGGLTMRAVRLLPFSVDPVVEDRTRHVEFGLNFGSRFERHTEEPLVLMTQRSRLDTFLAKQAAAAGADFRDGVKVTELELTARGVEARVNGTKIAANAALGADGVNGLTARAAGLGAERDYGVALEANVPYGVVSRERYRGRLCLELANVPGGYGWVFPKGDHVNVGVGGWEREGPRMREHLARFCREYAIPESDLERYDRELRRALASQLAAAWGAKVALDRFPRLTYAAVRSPYVWKAVVALIGGEVPSPSAMRGLRRASLRVVEGIARAAGDPGRAYRAAET